MLRALKYFRSGNGFIDFSRRTYSTSRPPRYSKYVKEMIIPLIIAFEATHICMQYVVRIRTASGPSMLPTLAMHELVVEENIRHEYFPQTLERGNLVSFISPLNPTVLVCKRILGLPGDVILVDPTAGPATPPEGTATELQNERHVIISPGHIWVQGDNATASRDSRTYGPVPISLVRGRLICGFGFAPGPTTFKWYNQRLTKFS